MTRSDWDWYKRYPKKFIRGVVGLGPDLIGAYSVVLDLIYEDEDSCKNDPHWIGGILGCNGRKAAALIEGLIRREKIYEKDGRLFNVKATTELETRQKNRRRARDDAETPARHTADDAETVSRQSSDNRPASNKNNDLPIPEKRRGEKRRGEKRRKEGSAEAKGANAPTASSPSSQPPAPVVPSDIDLAVLAYNAGAEKCPGGRGAGWAASRNNLTATREKALRARLAEVGLDGWRAAIDRGVDSDFLSGRGSRSPGRERWGVDIGWLAKAENFTKLVEGKYDNDRGERRAVRGQESARAGLLQFLEESERGGAE